MLVDDGVRGGLDMRFWVVLSVKLLLKNFNRDFGPYIIHVSTR